MSRSLSTPWSKYTRTDTHASVAHCYCLILGELSHGAVSILSALNPKYKQITASSRRGTICMRLTGGIQESAFANEYFVVAVYSAF